MGRWLSALDPLRQVLSHDPPEMGPAAREARHEHDTTCHLKNKLCGSRLEPRHHSAKKNWALAPCILFFVYDLTERWRCSGGEAVCPQGPSFGSRACASDRPPALFSKTEENQRPCEPALSRSVGDDSGSGSRNHSLLHGGSHGQVRSLWD